MFAAGEGHTLRTMEVDHLIQRFQPLIKHRCLAGNTRLQVVQHAAVRFQHHPRRQVRRVAEKMQVGRFVKHLNMIVYLSCNQGIYVLH